MKAADFKEFVTFPLKLMVRPFSCFADLKTGDRGSKKMIIVMLVLVWIAIAFQKQYAGLVVNTNDPLTMNSIVDLYGVLAVFLLWCVGNWSITSLTDGEGKLIQIMTATAYVMTPYYLAVYLATFMSRFMTLTEAPFYFMIISIATFWSAFLLFAAVITIHNYTVAKALLTIFLSFISMLVIIFLIILIGGLLQQVYVFCYSIYTEISYRL